MTFKEYTEYFKSILNNPTPPEPYNNPDYLNYTKLNWSRMNRWLKKGKLSDELKKVVNNIDKTQKWIVITEPWCGDAAQIVPFFEMMAELNPKIEISYELRDSEPFRINQYLTNGKSKSIPILVIKDEKGKDISHWGPRPKDAQALHYSLVDKKVDFEEAATTLQNWYNEDKGAQLQAEIIDLLNPNLALAVKAK